MLCSSVFAAVDVAIVCFDSHAVVAAIAFLNYTINNLKIYVIWWM